MSKFILLMYRDSEANGKSYNLPANLVSKNLDPALHSELSNLCQFYSSIEDAEASAKKIAKQLFVYDHTKRPRVLKDFRLYRWWVLDAEKPVQLYCGCYHYGSTELDRGEFKTLAETYPRVWCYGTKDAIVKKGKIDFSNEADLSKGAIAKRAKAQRDRYDAEFRDPKRYIKYYVDSRNMYDAKLAIDLIPQASKWIKGFHKDSLNLLTKYCFVYPVMGCQYTDRAALALGATPRSRKKVWACSISTCVYEKEADWKANRSEMYRSVTKVFPTREAALIHASLLGFSQPQVFETFKRPDYVNTLLGYIDGIGGVYAFPAEVYRLMVLDGIVQPIKKFMKDNAAKKSA